VLSDDVRRDPVVALQSDGNGSGVTGYGRRKGSFFCLRKGSLLCDGDRQEDILTGLFKKKDRQEDMGLVRLHLNLLAPARLQILIKLVLMTFLFSEEKTST
jgi:hypothetical protein